MSELQTHPFPPFTPPGSTTLILGSFTSREGFQGEDNFNPSYDWYYGTRRNQFWPILEQVYGRPLKTRQSKQELFTVLHIAIADIIQRCRRRNTSSSDSDLVILEYNEKINEIVAGNPIRRILFTSRFVESKFRSHYKELIAQYPHIELVALPSSSPRYARMTKDAKVKRYKELLPRVNG